MSKKLTRRKAYQVVRDEGLRTIPIGTRIVSKQRAQRICLFLMKRGHDVRVRYYGEIVLPNTVRNFD